jgi:hypothetical protein
VFGRNPLALRACSESKVNVNHQLKITYFEQLSLESQQKLIKRQEEINFFPAGTSVYLRHYLNRYVRFGLSVRR